jgi:hypothetical protein
VKKQNRCQFFIQILRILVRVIGAIFAINFLVKGHPKCYAVHGFFIPLRSENIEFYPDDNKTVK